MSKRPIRPSPHPGPRVLWARKAQSSDADDAVFLASAYGLVPDDWQEQIVDVWLRRRRNGKWRHRRNGLAVPRQNGKNGAIEVRELYGMVILGEAFLHAAHEVKTTKKAFKRLKSFFGEKADDTDARYPELNALVSEVRSTNGQEGIFLHPVCLTCRMPVRSVEHVRSPGTRCGCEGDARRQRPGGSIEFIARSGGSGRGFTVDVLVLDEAQHLTDEQLEAIRSTISSAPLGNSQVIYAGTPPNTEKGQLGEVFLRIRQGAPVSDDVKPADLKRDLSWIEYGVPDGPLDEIDLDDVAQLFATNPALGVQHGNGKFGLDFETVEGERGDLSAAGYARERLGWFGFKPGAKGGLFGSGRWAAIGNPDLTPPRPSAIGVSVSLDSEWVSIGAAGSLPDGRRFLGAVQRAPHDGWVVAEVKRIQEEQRCLVVMDEKCPDADLLQLLRDAGVEVTVLKLDDRIETASALLKGVKARTIAHAEHPELTAAVELAAWRTVGDRRLIGRKQSEGDVSMLDACADALGGLLADLDYDLSDSVLQV